MPANSLVVFLGKALRGIVSPFAWLRLVVKVAAWLEDRKDPFVVSWSRYLDK